MLQWWNCIQLSIIFLSHMACNILPIYMSIVASKSALSTGGRVFDPHMTSLKPNTIEALIFALVTTQLVMMIYKMKEMH